MLKNETTLSNRISYKTPQSGWEKYGKKLPMLYYYFIHTCLSVYVSLSGREKVQSMSKTTSQIVSKKKVQQKIVFHFTWKIKPLLTFIFVYTVAVGIT